MKKLLAFLLFLGLAIGIGGNFSVNADVDPEDFTEFGELLPRP